MLSESHKACMCKRGTVFLAVCAVALIGTGAVAARVQDPLHRVVAHSAVAVHSRAPAEARSQPHGRPRARTARRAWQS